MIIEAETQDTYHIHNFTTMAGQPPRRSSRQDAMARADSDAIAAPARDGTAEDDGAATIVASRRPSRSSVPRARRCSLQSLPSEEAGGGAVESHSPRLTRTARIPTDFPVGGGVTVAATHARRGGRAGTVRRHTARYVVVALDDDDDDGGEIRVSPKFLIPGRIRRTPSREAPVVGDFEERPASKVRFDMGRNSTAEYDREGPPENIIMVGPSRPPPSSSRDPPPPPPNVVEHLPGEIDDDDVTRRNEEILAEWDELFDDHRHSKGPAHSFDERYNNLFFRVVSL